MTENLNLLQGLTRNRAAVDWFKGLFKRAHLELTDTGEKFTIVHHGDSVEAFEGLRGENPNLIVPLESENIRRLAAAFANGGVDAQVQYRIVKFMLKPCLKAALVMPILKNKALRQIVKVDTHWQEALLDPQGNEDEQVTVIHVNKQWLVIPGYHGKPQRRLVVTPEQLLDFQRRVFEADETGKLSAWLSLAKWYAKWREDITV